MRLIDADKLIKVLKDRATNEAIMGYMTAYDVINSIIDEVEEQPTAYDVDKVVKELDKASDYYECEEQGREHVQMVDLTDAIEIVRGGVIND